MRKIERLASSPSPKKTAARVGTARTRKTSAKREVVAPRASQASDANLREILDAAAIAFMEHGYAATSIDTVAEVLGATKGRIYYYFRTKADLFFELHREAMRLNLDTIEPIAASGGDVKDRLRRMLHAQADLVMTHLALQKVAIQGVELHLTGRTTPKQRETLTELIAMRDRFERCFVDVLREGIEDRSFRDSDPEMVVKPLLGAINWMTFWYRPRASETQQLRQKIASEAVTLLIEGISRT